MNFAQLARSVRDLARRSLAHPLAKYLPASWHGPEGGKAPPAPAPVRKAAPAGARGLLARVPGASLSFLALAGLAKTKTASAPAAPPAPVPSKPKVVPDAPTDDDDDPDDEMRGDRPAAVARRRERSRCEEIITSPAGLSHPAAARKLALATRTPRAEALALLQSLPAPIDRAAASAARAARNPRIGVGMPEGGHPAAAIASRWDQAFARANGKTG